MNKFRVKIMCFDNDVVLFYRKLEFRQINVRKI